MRKLFHATAAVAALLAPSMTANAADIFARSGVPSSGLTKMTSLGLRRGRRPRRVGSAEPSPPSGGACLLGLFGL